MVLKSIGVCLALDPAVHQWRARESVKKATREMTKMKSEKNKINGQRGIREK